MKRHTALAITLMTLTLSACNTPFGSDKTDDVSTSFSGNMQQNDQTHLNSSNENSIALTGTIHEIPVNISESTLVREGEKTIITDYFHIGTADFSDITITADEMGTWTSIDAIVDMTSLKHTGGQSEQVMTHLKSDDFFGVETYPTAYLTSTDVTQTQSGYLITADLTIKDQTHPIQFLLTSDDKTTYNASFAIDRTQRNITFGSDNFFDNLGDNIIDDMIHYDVTIVTQ